MIPPHDHERDDDLRPDPYIEVSWSGRIKKKKRRRTDKHLYQPQVEQTTRSAAQPQTARPQSPQPARPRTAPRPSPGRPNKKFPFVFFTVIFFFILLQVPNLLPNLLKARPTSTPSASPELPQFTPPSFPPIEGPTMPEDAMDELEIAVFTYDLGAWASNRPFITSVQNVTTNVEEHFELDPADNGLYLAFEIGIINSSIDEEYFDFPTGWTENRADPQARQVTTCGLEPTGDDISVEEITSVLVPTDETFDIYHCVKLPDDFDPDDPGYLFIDSFEEKTWWRIPEEIFN